MDADSTQDTIPSPAVRRASNSPLGRFIRSVPGAFLILASVLGTVLTLAALGGYYAGQADRHEAAATAQFEELARQYQLAQDDIAAGRYGLAIQRYEFILALDPDFPGAAAQLAQARTVAPPSEAGLGPTDPGPVQTPVITVGPESAQAMLAKAQAAFDSGDWDAALQEVNALRVLDPDYERAAVRNLTFGALRNRGIDYINAGKLELGLADLDQASRLGSLDAEAQQFQQWATIYIAGTSYWGLNWPRTIETFQLLYTIAPYFRDTIPRLREANLSYARQLDSQGDPCSAVFYYAEALEIEFDQATEDRRAAADIACQFGTPTPDGTLTPFPTVEGTPDPEATPDLNPGETITPTPEP